jgi:hypothetical protein
MKNFSGSKFFMFLNRKSKRNKIQSVKFNKDDDCINIKNKIKFLSK